MKIPRTPNTSPLASIMFSQLLAPVRIGLLLTVIAMLPASVTAQAATSNGMKKSTEAPVQVFNRTIAVFRAPLFGVDAEQRAHRTEIALKDIFDMGGDGVVTVEEAPQGNVIMIDGKMAFILLPQDVDRFKNESLNQATQNAVSALQEVERATKESRNKRRLTASVILTVMTISLFFLLATLLLRMRHRIVSRFTKRLEKQATQIGIAGESPFQADLLGMLVRMVVNVITILALLGALQWSVGFILQQFPYTRPWGAQVESYLLELLGRLTWNVLAAIPDLIIALMIFVLARIIVRMIRHYFDRVGSFEENTGWLNSDTAVPSRRIASLLVWVFALVMAYPYLPGSGSEAFKGISLLLGLMISIGGSNLFAQVVSGGILIYSRSLRVGEFIQINEHEGSVREIGMFATKIVTGTGVIATLPNAYVLTTATRNYSRPVAKGYVLEVSLSIGYDTPWRQVEAMLIEAAGRVRGVLANPAPHVFQAALSDFYPVYCLVCHARPEPAVARPILLGELHAHIQDVFNQYGVQIMSPHYLSDPEHKKIVPSEHWHSPPAFPNSSID